MALNLKAVTKGYADSKKMGRNRKDIGNVIIKAMPCTEDEDGNMQHKVHVRPRFGLTLMEALLNNQKPKKGKEGESK